MSKLKVLIIIIIAVLVSFFCGFKFNEYRYNLKLENEKKLQQQFDEYAINKENQYMYPQEKDFDRGISVTYTSEVLAKKSKGETLTSEESELISYHEVQSDGYGIAITRFHEYDGGMGKATRRIWETADGGQHWSIMTEQTYSIGIYDYTYIDNIFIEAAFATTAERGYFNISEDRGHKFKSIPYSNVFDYDSVAYAKKVEENIQKKTVTYEWIDLYTKESISTVEYDFDMNIINEKK